MRFSLCALVLVSAGLLAGCSDDDDQCTCPADEVISIGHRGTGVNHRNNPYPENTIPSFLQAEAEGADMVELDVVHSADGVQVVIHDDTVGRTTDGTGCVGDLSVAELQLLDAGFGTDMEGDGVVIPTLAESLAAISVGVDIEIKVVKDASCPAPDLDLLAEDVVAAIQGDTKDRGFIVTSFEFGALEAVKLEDPSVYVGFVSSDPADAARAAAAGFDALALMGNFYGENEIQMIRGEGLDVSVWTINDAEKMREFFGLGIFAIITDEPDLLESERQAFCEGLCGVMD